VGDGAAIRADALTKDHCKGHGLFALDLEVERGEVSGFLGPNGAGKRDDSTIGIAPSPHAREAHLHVGLANEPLCPPAGGRAPGWASGLAIAARTV
jgi:ABC-type dipeptide/oligopeptide/nickel transport system ATPase subunit